MDKTQVLKAANDACKNTMMETMNIVFTDIGPDFVVAEMPVNSRVHQPAGLLHGGANAALAESVGSLGSFVLLNDPKLSVVGIEINANHVRSVRSGKVVAHGKIVHLGRKTHVWEIKITDQEGKLLSICRLTNMVLTSGE